MKSQNRPVEEIPIGFVYSDGKRCYVLSRTEAAKKDEFAPPNAVHTATVALDVVLERILNKEDGWKKQLAEMKGK